MTDLAKSAGYASQSDQAALRAMAFARQAGVFAQTVNGLRGETATLVAAAQDILTRIQAENNVSVDYEWDGSKLRLRKTDGEWGQWVDLVGPAAAAEDTASAAFSGVSATNVQAALQEIYTESARATHAHDASEVAGLADIIGQALQTVTGISPPTDLNTIVELAAAIGNDPNFVASVATALSGKQASNVKLTNFADLAGGAAKVPVFTDANALSLIAVGAAANNLVALDANAKLPGYDGSQLLNVVAGYPSVLGAALAGNTTLTTAYKGKLVKFTGTPVLTADAAATLGDGWSAFIVNAGTGIGSLVLGATTYQVYPGEPGFLVQCDGTGFSLVGRTTHVAAADVTISSAQASVDFEAVFADPDIKSVHVEMVGLSHNNGSNATLTARLKIGGSYLTSGYLFYSTTGAEGSGYSGFDQGPSGDAAVVSRAKLDLSAIKSGTSGSVLADWSWFQSGAEAGTATRKIGTHTSAGVIQGLRFIYSAGQIDAGRFIVTGSRV